MLLLVLKLFVPAFLALLQDELGREKPLGPARLDPCLYRPGEPADEEADQSRRRTGLDAESVDVRVNVIQRGGRRKHEARA